MARSLSKAQLRILEHLAIGKNKLTYSGCWHKYVWAAPEAGPRLNSRSVERLRTLGLVSPERLGPYDPLFITEAGRQVLAEQERQDG